jgi:hypothetical protein
LNTEIFFRLYIYLELEEDEEDEEDLDESSSLNAAAAGAGGNNGGGGGAKNNDKHPKKLFKVSASTEGSCKITISAHTPQPGVNNTAAAVGTAHGGGGGGERKRKNKEKDFASPSSESKIQVHSGLYLPPSSALGGGGGGDGDGLEKCAVSIQFDPNTKKLWQELHYPYGNYTSFFRYRVYLPIDLPKIFLTLSIDMGTLNTCRPLNAKLLPVT